MNRLVLATMLLLTSASPLWAQRDLAQIPDPDPEVERRSFEMAEGFAVNLFAADPVLAKPIQMNFDAEGRLWLVCSEVYPQIEPGQEANDKVLVLEDRDGDGRADKTTVFADGLLIPTGIEPGDGGAYVANSTELLHLKDTDGDGKADARRVILSGFGTEDTHHILHTLRWGFDGMLYFNQSVYIHSHIETPYGVRRLGGGGIWQFRPETMRLEVFLHGLWNPWGHLFDRWGVSFATDGAGGEGINYVLPGAYYASAPDAVRVLPGLNPGSPKYCGAEVLSGRHLPEGWRGNLLTNDFRANRVCRFVLSDDGAGFAARELPELIKTRHAAFRPIDVKMGPDGAIYIADWYNPIIQHGEVDFRDPRRDHTRGRIWRVTAKGRPLVERPQLVGAPTQALLEALKAPEDWTRHFARRVLKERGTVVVPDLAAWVKRLDQVDPDGEHKRLEALWTYQALDVVEPELLAALLDSAEPHVRAAATRVVQHWADRLSDPMTILAARVIDDHPRVRLEAVRVLAHVPQVRAMEVALRALDRPADRFLDYALWLTARELAPVWLPAVQGGRLNFGGDARRLVFALGAAGSPQVVGPLVESLRAGRIPPEQEQGVLTLVATLGGPKELGLVFDLAVADGAMSPGRRAALLDALARATRQRQVRPEADLGRLGLWLASGEEAVRVASSRAAGLWQIEALRPQLLELAWSVETSDLLRQATIDGLAGLGGPASRLALEELAGAGRPHAVRMMAVAALAALDTKDGAARAAGVLADLRDGTDPSSLVAVFLQRKGGPAALAAALAGRTLPADVAKLGVRAARAAGHEEPALIAALTQAGGLSSGPVALTPEQMTQMVADVSRLGDPQRGEAVFRRPDQGCLKCHAIAGAGGQVGPGLESLGASAPIDYLIDAILQPGKAIKENYHSLVVATDDGRVVSGIKVRQTETELILRDAEDHEVAIPLSSIEEQMPGGSLMPAGQADTLTRGELIDLVRFLSELGKVGPYAVGKARVVRRWQVLTATPEAAEALRRTRLDTAVTDDSRFRWDPSYSRVDGTLPLVAVPALKPRADCARVGFLRCQLDVSTGGPARLLLNSPAGLSLWLDGARVEPGEQVTLDLSPGLRTLIFKIDLDLRREDLRCELDEVTGSPARVQAVVGK